MKNGKMKYGLLCLLAMLLTPLCVGAYDMLMPSLDIAFGMFGWQVILIGLVIEIIFIKFYLKATILKTVLIAFVMNLVSTILGAIALPLCGLVIELAFWAVEYGTYHISHWIPNILCAVAIYAALEALTAKVIFKYKFKSLFGWLCITNAITLVVFFLFNTFLFEHIHF